MTHKPDLDSMERALMSEAIETLRETFKGRPCMVIAGFEVSGGLKICAVSNVSTEDQIEMMNMLIDGYEPAPQGTTLN